VVFTLLLSLLFPAHFVSLCKVGVLRPPELDVYITFPMISRCNYYILY
jgi:hypothetical protein